MIQQVSSVRRYLMNVQFYCSFTFVDILPAMKRLFIVFNKFYSPSDIASHPKRLKTSATPPWEP